MSRVLVLGGARSGKSAHAEALLADRADVTYLAASAPAADDAEWGARVAAHRARRPATWTTVETTAPSEMLRPGAVLVDSVTTWVAALMDESGVWSDEPGAAERFERRCDALVEAWTMTPAHVVAVSDEVGLGVVPGTRAGRLFRDALGAVNQRLAGTADEVWFVVAGLPQRLR
ncbi:bifunctional adenosylcobinamide kinase/adenosylcobinamide-phosphate guanylyltransferase [Geodermatophilus sp. YIM 151500]|uniref:bifunctional adenosylcobinamide kinase/adenosylcobinamide-phosphate guanylyltransferase n=1 Tax=Geodermatophilus sp. YIM 151500 TaxID=2984531 RepID=UPI0021E4BDA9|nr:bifunctional adenosylcobinamide kinase/adenosylcobinamide-phosphate guanylyltransferase [Geodermatophilus sp. YIM 151500]MCV2491766.1 bifunctional adenosylcobinamide kinase/adenosylcobinamide-phosphate guanylyltransferase [Geodermatophilus sp. YIM 151500]